MHYLELQATLVKLANKSDHICGSSSQKYHSKTTSNPKSCWYGHLTIENYESHLNDLLYVDR